MSKSKAEKSKPIVKEARKLSSIKRKPIKKKVEAKYTAEELIAKIMSATIDSDDSIDKDCNMKNDTRMSNAILDKIYHYVYNHRGIVVIKESKDWVVIVKRVLRETNIHSNKSTFQPYTATYDAQFCIICVLEWSNENYEGDVLISLLDKVGCPFIRIRNLDDVDNILDSI